MLALGNIFSHNLPLFPFNLSLSPGFFGDLSSSNVDVVLLLPGIVIVVLFFSVVHFVVITLIALVVVEVTTCVFICGLAAGVVYVPILSPISLGLAVSSIAV